MKKSFALAAALSFSLPCLSYAGEAFDSLVNAERTSSAAARDGSVFAAQRTASAAMDGAKDDAAVSPEFAEAQRKAASAKAAKDASDAVGAKFEEIMPDVKKDDVGSAMVKGFTGAIEAPFYLTYVGAKEGGKDGIMGGAKGAVGGLFMGLFGLFMGPVIALSVGFSTAMGNPPSA